MSYSLDYGQVWQYIPFLLGGAWVALQIAFLATALGCLLGAAGAALLSHGGRAAQRSVRAYVSFFTSTPQLVTLMAIFFALPNAGMNLSPFAAAVLALMLAEAAYLCEVIRAGVLSISPGQLEAADALGLSRLQIFCVVRLPYAVRALYPTLCNQFILCVLYTSLASVIGVEEVMGRGMSVNATTFRSFEIFSLVAVIYLLLTLITTAALYAAGRWLFRVRIKAF